MAPGGGSDQSVWVSGFYPLSRAEHRHGGRNQRADLSDPAVRRGSFRARLPTWPRAGDAGHGGFFLFVFFSAKENEPTDQ